MVTPDGTVRPRRCSSPTLGAVALVVGVLMVSLETVEQRALGRGVSSRWRHPSEPCESQSFTVDVARGTYELFCPVPGHKQAGMVVTITISG